jgi:hypothetical protein
LGLRLLVKLNISQAVSSGKDAIDDMKGEKIEAVKERISSQQIAYIEALGKSLRRSTASKQTAVAFLGPRFAPPVVAVAFPKTEFFGFCKLQPVNPFSAFPCVQVGNYQPHWAAVVWG